MKLTIDSVAFPDIQYSSDVPRQYWRYLLPGPYTVTYIKSSFGGILIQQVTPFEYELQIHDFFLNQPVEFSLEVPVKEVSCMGALRNSIKITLPGKPAEQIAEHAFTLAHLMPGSFPLQCRKGISRLFALVMTPEVFTKYLSQPDFMFGQVPDFSSN